MLWREGEGRATSGRCYFTWHLSRAGWWVVGGAFQVEGGETGKNAWPSWKAVKGEGGWGTLAASEGGRKCLGGGGQESTRRGPRGTCEREWLFPQICRHPLRGTEQTPSNRLENGGARGLQTRPSQARLASRRTPQGDPWLPPSSPLLRGASGWPDRAGVSASLVAAPVRVAEARTGLCRAAGISRELRDSPISHRTPAERAYVTGRLGAQPRSCALETWRKFMSD